MSISTRIFRIVAKLWATHPGHVLTALRAHATSEFDGAVQKAHDKRVEAEKVISGMAVDELERVEALTASLGRRAAALIASNTVPETHADRVAHLVGASSVH